jgi:hypothetical protein
MHVNVFHDGFSYTRIHQQYLVTFYGLVKQRDLFVHISVKTGACGRRLWPLVHSPIFAPDLVQPVGFLAPSSARLYSTIRRPKSAIHLVQLIVETSHYTVSGHCNHSVYRRFWFATVMLM